MLPGGQVLEAAEVALLSARADGKPLEEILLTALEAGAAAGGDKRCGKQRATSAFVVVISADLPWWEPQLSVNVHHLPAGVANAVTILPCAESSASSGNAFPLPGVRSGRSGPERARAQSHHTIRARIRG